MSEACLASTCSFINIYNIGEANFLNNNEILQIYALNLLRCFIQL